MTHPPQPWSLRGDLHVSVWLLPKRSAPSALPPGCRAFHVGPWAVVGTAWVDYRPGGVLVYRELMATVLVRTGLRLLPTITHIWVDSEPSRDGGRALWAIPKDLAHFEVHGSRWTADHGATAAADVRPGRRLPGRWPVRFSVVQDAAGKPLRSPVRTRTALRLSRVAWQVPAAGPLGFLAGRTPLLSATMTDFDMTFGR